MGNIVVREEMHKRKELIEFLSANYAARDYGYVVTWYVNGHEVDMVPSNGKLLLMRGEGDGILVKATPEEFVNSLDYEDKKKFLYNLDLL